MDNSDGHCPLIIAVGRGESDAVMSLLDGGADIGHMNDYGYNALSSALWSSHLELARQLVARGALVSIDDAAALGDVDRLRREWQPMPGIEDTIGAFLCACRCGQTEVVEWMLEQGIPVDLHPSGVEWGGIGCPGLHHAATHGHVDTVRLLLAHGADPSLVDDVFGTTALFWADMDGRREVVDVLRAAGSR
jgi:uncharacterized protein